MVGCTPLVVEHGEGGIHHGGRWSTGGSRRQWVNMPHGQV